MVVFDSVVNGLRWWRPICNFTVGQRWVIPKASIVELRLIGHRLLYLKERLKLAPTVLTVDVALRETLTQGNSSLVQHKVNVLGLLTIEVAVPVWRDGLGSLDDLDIQTGAKGGKLGDNEFVVPGVPVSGKVLGKLAETKSCQNGDNIGVVGKVKVKALIQRERLRHAIKSGVDLGARVAKCMVLKTRNDLLLVTKASCSLYSRLTRIVWKESMHIRTAMGLWNPAPDEKPRSIE